MSWLLPKWDKGFREEKTAVGLRLDFGHVALCRAQARDSAMRSLKPEQVSRGPAVGCRRFLPRRIRSERTQHDRDRLGGGGVSAIGV